MKDVTPPLQFVLVAVGTLLVAGACSSTSTIKVPNTPGGVTVIDYGAERRGAYLFQDSEGRHVLVSEPSPDVARDVTSAIELSASTIGEVADPKAKLDYASKVVDLASRSQTLQVLREALFRLAEMGAATDLTVEQRMAIYLAVLDTVRIIAATEFVKTDAPDAAKDQVLERFLGEVGPGTLGRDIE